MFLSFTFTLYFYILDLSGFRFFPVGSCGTYLLGYIVTGATMSFAVFSMIDVFVVAYYFRDQKKKYMVCFLLETMATLALLPCYSSNIFIKNVIFSVITNNVYWLTFAIFVAKSALVMLYTPYLLYEFVYRKFSKKGGAAR
ncbi:MAG: hypothetical protein LBI29_00575 [Rickettsiales bacterium]|nr:hypothetical protein [Rickettsiales bacterium]